MKINKLSIAAACLWAFVAAPAQGALFLSINPSNQVVSSPSSGNFFDVVLNNTSASSFAIAGFSYELSVGTTDFVFAGASTGSPLYLFLGDSFADSNNSGDIRTSPNGQTLAASDLTDSGLAITLAGNSTASLGRVTFSILSGAPTGPIAITFGTGPGTSLSDASGNAITLDASVNGQVTVDNSVVPEPSSAFLMILALPAVAILRKRR